MLQWSTQESQMSLKNNQPVDLGDLIAFSVILLIVVLVLCIVIWSFCKMLQFLCDLFSSPRPPMYIQQSYGHRMNSGLRKTYALDAEMVGAGDRGQIQMLARVAIVNRYGQCIYDEYVAPVLPVTDYRTFVSGIREEDLIGAPSFYTVQRQVMNIIDDCILVGHDLKFDLGALSLSHPSRDLRDTALYEPFREVSLFLLKKNF